MAGFDEPLGNADQEDSRFVENSTWDDEMWNFEDGNFDENAGFPTEDFRETENSRRMK